MRSGSLGILAGAALLAFALGASAQDGRTSLRLEPAPGLLGEIWGDADFRSRGDAARFKVKVRGVAPGTPLRLLVGGVEVASAPADRGCGVRFDFRSDAGDGGNGDAPLGGGGAAGNGNGNGGVGDLPGTLELRCIRTRNDFGSGGGRGERLPLGFDPRGQLIEVVTGELTLLSGTLDSNEALAARGRGGARAEDVH
jgi:hypothetical protein